MADERIPFRNAPWSAYQSMLQPMDRASSFVRSQLYGGEPQLPQQDDAAGMLTGKRAALFGAGMAPGAGATTAAGMFPTAEGGYEPSAAQDWRNGDYLSSALKWLGAAGDAATATGVGAGIGGMMKAPLAMKLAMAGGGMKKVNNADRILRKVSKEQLEGDKILGAPLGVNNPQAETARRTNYINTVIKGVLGRHWYDDSGGSIFFHTGENPELSNKVAEAGAVTSASTGVDPNTQFMIRGHNQAMAGDPISTGRYPTRMGQDIAQVYHEGGTASGQKRSPFADQIAIGGNYYVKPNGQGHRGVHDIWDGEAWGYIDDKGAPLRRQFREPEHSWMDRQMDQVIDYLNRNQVGLAQGMPGPVKWTPGNAQAAAWTGAKINAGTLDPADAAISYADILKKNYAQGSRETVPGKNWGNDTSMLYAPWNDKVAYHDAIRPAIYDEKGRDKISLGYGMLTGKSFDGPGVFEGGLNPGTQTQVAVSRAVGSNDLGASEHKLLKGIESTYGLLGGQDAAAYNSASPAGSTLKTANRSNLDLGRTINNDEMNGLVAYLRGLQSQRGLEDLPLAPVPTPGGVRLLDMGDNPQQFVTDAREAARVLGIDPKKLASFTRGDGGYIPAGEAGSNYVRNIMELERARDAAGLPSGFDASAPGIAKAWMEADKQFGFKPDSQLLETIRKAVADNGRAGLEELIRRGVIPLSVAAMVAPAYLNSNGEPASNQTVEPGL